MRKQYFFLVITLTSFSVIECESLLASNVNVTLLSQTPGDAKESAAIPSENADKTVISETDTLSRKRSSKNCVGRLDNVSRDLKNKSNNANRKYHTPYIQEFSLKDEFKRKSEKAHHPEPSIRELYLGGLRVDSRAKYAVANDSRPLRIGANRNYGYYKVIKRSIGNKAGGHGLTNDNIPRHFSSKILVGSPLDVKNQGTFSTTTSLKSGSPLSIIKG